MIQTNASGGGNDAGVSVHASVLTTTTTTTSSANNRYKRLWKRTISVGVLVTVNKKSSSPSPLPPTPTTTTLAEQLCRTFSSHSSSLEIVIDIHEQEDEEKEEERPGTVVNEVVIDQRQHHLRDKVNRFVEDRDLKSLTDFGGVEQVATLFNSNLNTGLCVAADAANDLQTWNTTTANHPLHGFMHYFKAACNSYTIFLLLISAALTFGTEILMQGTKYGWEHGATILVAIFLLVTVAPMAEFHRAKIEHKEMQKKEYKVRVIRNGEPRIVGVSSIMLGDIVDLKEGDRVPADGLFVGDDRLVLDEVSSAPSDIDSHHNPFLLYGFKDSSEGIEEQSEADLRKLSLHLLSIAKRHEGYQTMWNICCDLNDSELLRNLRDESMGPKGGFSYFVFKQLYDSKQFSKLLRLGEEFQEELATFLKRHRDLLWLHEVFLHQFCSASENLHALALSQDDNSIAEAVEGTESYGKKMEPTLAERKLFLQLSKIAAVAGCHLYCIAPRLTPARYNCSTFFCCSSSLKIYP